MSSVNFLTEPDDDMKCLICLDVARDPLQHEACGRLFCKQCLEKYGKTRPCPNCRERQSSYYVDKRSRRAIEGLKVKCNNADKKCKWEGTFGILKNHLDACEFTLIFCPKQCKDSSSEPKQVMRKDLNEHLKSQCPLREHTCRYCGKDGTYTEITGVHAAICIMRQTPCKKCGEILPYCKMEQHEELECLHTVVACTYEDIGCKANMKRKDMAAHVETSRQNHLDMAMANSQKLEEMNLKLKKEMEVNMAKANARIKELEQTVATLSFRNEATLLEMGILTKRNEKLTKSQSFVTAFSIANFEKKKLSNTRFVSQPFYSSENGYKLAVVVGTNCNESLSVFLGIRKGRYDKKLSWPFVGDMTITLLNQLNDDNHFSHTLRYAASNNMKPGSEVGESKFITHPDLSLKGYLVNNTLHFRIYLKLS